MIPLSIPHLAGNEWEYVKECLDTGWVSTAGAYVGKFEEAIAKFTDSRYAISCMNGTAGLHTAMNLLGIGAGDYVLAPNLTFVATLNAISYTKAEALLLDIDPDNWQLDLDLLQRFLEEDTYVKEAACYLKADDRRIAAIMPVHVLGNMCDMDRLAALSERHHLPVIEDSTEALGSTFRGRHAGTFGIFGTSSFNGNKIITTGGGGMIFTQKEDLAVHAKHLTTTAKTDPLDYFHDEVGYNYRLVNVLAAIGLAQMEQLPGLIRRKKHMDAFYRERLGGVGDITFQRVTEGVDPNCWLFTFRTQRMRELLTYLNERGVQSRPFWTPMNQLPMYRSLSYYTEEDHAARVHATAISIPSSSGLTDAELEEVVATIREFYRT
ncbi:aminotransferase in exopolysaccharide biosynthesis [Lewinella aquimaris]|uniref:Aminotransferase in exopolysaccharide biosynthesis n=1 Tax=Neolewinella aquimaris TaxID=1835722 RepID=A0A840E4W2_9BACT|nr:LegC family aminotransferase [Neolewinella aquimaris]MBB4080221.1 aminotransferase in exopolysaccharide biosynthesis [Neolewinella aquimaris]